MAKPEYVYPGSDFDRARNLLTVLGTFWAKTYTGSDQLLSYVTALGLGAAQAHRNLLEVVAATSRYEVPIFHEELLVPIVIRKSELNSNQINASAFDQLGIYFNGKLQFDVPPESALFSFPVPAALKNVQQIFNKIVFPTSALLGGVDFVVDPDAGAIRFTTNPFNNESFLRSPVQEAADDEEIMLWGFCGDFDYQYVFTQFAYALGLQLNSSENSKLLMNAITNGLVNGGAAAKDIDLAFSALCGIPLTSETKETIEAVFYDSRGLVIASDLAVYRFQEPAEPLVGVGAVLPAGSQLVRCFEVLEFFNLHSYKMPGDDNIIPAAKSDELATQIFEPIVTENDSGIVITTIANPRKELLALAVDNGFLPACFLGDLVFENKVIPLEVATEHPTGYTYVKFKLGGFPADAAQFFDMLHARGIALAEAADNPCVVKNKRTGTLAHILDRREQATDEPTIDDLPQNINPMRFLIENVLRNNVFVVRIVVAALGVDALNLHNIRHLRRLIPPQTAMIVVFELSGKTEEIAGDKMLDDVPATFTGAEPASDNIDDTYVIDEGVFARLLSGTCQ